MERVHQTFGDSCGLWLVFVVDDVVDTCYRWLFVFLQIYESYIIYSTSGEFFVATFHLVPEEHSGGTRQKISQLGSLKFKAPLKMSNWVVVLDILIFNPI